MLGAVLFALFVFDRSDFLRFFFLVRGFVSDHVEAVILALSWCTDCGAFAASDGQALTQPEQLALSSRRADTTLPESAPRATFLCWLKRARVSAA